MHHLVATEKHEEKPCQDLYKNAMRYFKEILEAIGNKTGAVRQLTSHLKKLSNKTCCTPVRTIS